MQTRDIPAGMRLKAAAGWNQTEQDWRLLLALRPDGCFVATCEGQVVGTVTTVRYGDALSWIGMLLVDPAYRRQGIGTRLMEEAIASLAGCQTIGLDATSAGRKLYSRLEFRDAYGLHRLTMTSLLSVPRPSAEVRPIAREACAQVAELDRRVFGAERTPVLAALWEWMPALAWQCARGGQVSGFCLGRDGARFCQVGPLVAETTDEALALCRAAMAELVGPAVVLDVPAAQETFLAWLQGVGFTVQRSFTRMILGRGSTPGVLAQQYAIAGPELG
jgi:ribosomal protein S18 acetylase RimI-like enzyme